MWTNIRITALVVAVLVGPRLHHLDHDAERLLRVEERLLPLRVAVVVAHDRVAERLARSHVCRSDGALKVT